jgi:hypothetical protein
MEVLVRNQAVEDPRLVTRAPGLTRVTMPGGSLGSYQAVEDPRGPLVVTRVTMPHGSLGL